jgi:hypothetical protein
MVTVMLILNDKRKFYQSAQGSASSSLISFQKSVTLETGKNKIDLLSATIGLSVIHLDF